MMIDGEMNFGIPAISNSNTATASTNVLDAGAAKILFGNRSKLSVKCKAKVTADASPSIKVDLIGSDAAALNSNNVVIASSGVIATDEDGTALASGDVIEFDFAARGQFVAKRYYGLLVTLGGTNPDTVAAECFAVVVMDAHTNMVGERAAIPA